MTSILTAQELREKHSALPSGVSVKQLDLIKKALEQLDTALGKDHMMDDWLVVGDAYEFTEAMRDHLESLGYEVMDRYRTLMDGEDYTYAAIRIKSVDEPPKKKRRT